MAGANTFGLIVWTLQYNTLNQLTQKYDGTSWTSGNERWSYAYDDNGNLTSVVQEVYNVSVWEVSEEWKYEWNPRDQMTQAMKWAGSSSATDNVGAVAYEYCLSCDGALSMRLEYDAGTDDQLGTLVAGLRYEYDGLNPLRVDELFNYDGDGSIQDELDYYRNTASDLRHRVWRTVEVSTHRPGQVSALLHKRVYIHTNNDATPDQTKDFTYAHDPVGNVLSVFDSSGNEDFTFAQDAFGNELPINSAFGASDWGEAAGEDYRITEHQTCKWMDAFTGLYYFHARWYDGEVGRFVGRDPVRQGLLGDISSDIATCSTCGIYSFSANNPHSWFDPSGEITLQVCARGKAIRGKPGSHCFLCSGDYNIEHPRNNCQGCQIFKGREAETHDPDNWYNCMNTDVTQCQLSCIARVFDECCAAYNLLSVLTHNCCDCVRAALSECGLETPPNVVGVNCGL